MPVNLLSKYQSGNLKIHEVDLIYMQGKENTAGDLLYDLILEHH